MLYSSLGETGLIVSRLSLGTMTFTSGGGTPAIAKTTAEDADRMVGRAIDAGINFFDTADVYADGQSETILGQVLGSRRDEVVIATKAGWRTGKPLNRSGLSVRHLAWSIDQSLRRLSTDHVDIYIAHRDDVNTPIEETLMALDAIVRAGKARYLGVSNWPAWKVAAAIELQKANGWARFDHAQMMYSLVGRGIEDEFVTMASRYGLGITAWSPLAGGFLSGKYSRDKPADEGDRLSGFDMIPFDKDKGYDLVDTLRGIAEGHGASVAQVALAWVLAKPAISSVVIGASKPSQLDDNIAAADLALSDDELKTLDEATHKDPDYPARMALVHDEMIVKALAAKPGEVAA